MRRARSAEPKPMLRSVRWGAVLGSALAAFVVVSGALAGFTSLTTGGAQTIVTKRIFLGPRSLAAQDLRDASSGAETNKSDAYSYADGTVATTSTAIASGTNNYVEFTMSSARAGGLSVSGAQFNFRLASSGGAQAGNACFWFDVRSGGTVIGTHGSYASPSGCSTGTTQTTFSTAIPEVSSTDRANGLVIRAYVWETGHEGQDGQHRPRHGHGLDPVQRVHRLRDPGGGRHERHPRRPRPGRSRPSTRRRTRTRPTGRPPRPPRRSTSS